jgi:hypothetical protein
MKQAASRTLPSKLPLLRQEERNFPISAREEAVTQQINQNKLAGNTSSVLMFLMPKFACTLIAQPGPRVKKARPSSILTFINPCFLERKLSAYIFYAVNVPVPFGRILRSSSEKKGLLERQDSTMINEL